MFHSYVSSTADHANWQHFDHTFVPPGISLNVIILETFLYLNEQLEYIDLPCPVDFSSVFLICTVQCRVTNHMWLLSTQNVARATEELSMYLNLLDVN